MKSKIILFSIIITITAILSGSFGEKLIETTNASNQLFIERESKLNFTETVEALTKALPTDGWKISVVHDLQDALKKNGKDVLPVKVFEVCNPQYSGKILEADNFRAVSLMMPCRVSVYEKSNGKTYIAVMNSKPMAKSIGGIVETVIGEAQTGIDKKIKPFIK